GLAADRQYVLFPFDPARRVKRYDIAEHAVAVLRDRGVAVVLLPVWNVANEIMPLYYSAADVMVLCSDSEGSPTSVKEALACNLPVVCTNVGDVKDITRGIAGTQIVGQTVEALKAAVEQALQPPAGFVFQSRQAMERYGQER